MKDFYLDILVSGRIVANVPATSRREAVQKLLDLDLLGVEMIDVELTEIGGHLRGRMTSKEPNLQTRERVSHPKDGTRSDDEIQVVNRWATS